MRNMGYFILVLAILFLFSFCIFLTINNQRLNNIIKELKYEIDIKKITTNNENLFNTNKIPISEISNILEKNDKKKEEISNTNKTTINKISTKQENKKNERINNHNNILIKDLYNNKNKLETNSKNINLIYLDDPNEEAEKGDEVIMIKEDGSMNLNDFIKNNNILEETNPANSNNEFIADTNTNNVNTTSTNNMSFLENVYKQIEEQLEPQTIELTDYEKEQEENAIISYKEFLKVKDELYEINAAKENEQFIQDLKNFRNNLN